MWDIALFSQTFYTFLHGQFFYNTLENVSYFGIHVSPIIFLFVPFYVIAPFPETLLILQTGFLGAGIIPIFLYCRDTVGEKYGFFFSLLYLINPVLHGINLHEFHTDACIPLFIGMMLYGHLRGKTSIYLLFGLLSLTIKEDIVPIVGLLAFIGIIQSYRKANTTSLLVYSVLFIISGFWLLISFFFIIPTMRIGLEQKNYLFFDFFQSGIAGLAINGEFKVIFLFILLVPFLLLPLISPEISIIALPNLFEIFLPSHVKFYSIDFYYAASTLTIFSFATISSWEKILFKYQGVVTKIPSLIIIGMLISTGALSLAYSPAVGQMILMQQGMSIVDNQHEQAFNEALGLIPPDSSLATQHNLLTHCANRLKLFPEFRKGVEYILLDDTFFWRSSYYDLYLPEIFSDYDQIYNKSLIRIYKLRDNAQ